MPSSSLSSLPLLLTTKRTFSLFQLLSNTIVPHFETLFFCVVVVYSKISACVVKGVYVDLDIVEVVNLVKLPQ